MYGNDNGSRCIDEMVVVADPVKMLGESGLIWVKLKEVRAKLERKRTKLEEEYAKC